MGQKYLITYRYPDIDRKMEPIKAYSTTEADAFVAELHAAEAVDIVSKRVEVFDA